MAGHVARSLKFMILAGIMIGAFQNCGYIAAPMDSNLLGAVGNFGSSYKLGYNDVKPLFDSKCAGCHNAGSAGGGIILDSYTGVRAFIVPENPDVSPVYASMKAGRMPQGTGPRIGGSDLQRVYNWILTGGLETGVDESQGGGGAGGNGTAPTVFAGVAQTITVGGSTNFSGTVTGTGFISNVGWTKVSGGSATITGATTQTMSVTNTVVGSYTFRFTVTYTNGQSGYSDVGLTVLPVRGPTPIPTPSPTPRPGATATPVPAPTGASLYTKHCTNCHQPLDSSVKKGATVAQIKNGIQNYAQMRPLSVLTDAELALIVTALK